MDYGKTGKTRATIFKLYVTIEDSTEVIEFNLLESFTTGVPELTLEEFKRLPEAEYNQRMINFLNYIVGIYDNLNLINLYSFVDEELCPIDLAIATRTGSLNDYQCTLVDINVGTISPTVTYLATHNGNIMYTDYSLGTINFNDTRTINIKNLSEIPIIVSLNTDDSVVTSTPIIQSYSLGVGEDINVTIGYDTTKELIARFGTYLTLYVVNGETKKIYYNFYGGAPMGGG